MILLMFVGQIKLQLKHVHQSEQYFVSPRNGGKIDRAAQELLIQIIS